MEKYIAEFFGSLCLVFLGCGSIILCGAYSEPGIGLMGVSLAFGLTLTTMMLAIGHISGCHLNPAVSIGLWVAGRLPTRDLPGYIASQLLGGLMAAGLLYLIASGKPGFDFAHGFAANGFGEHSPGGFDMLSALVIEIVMTLMLVFVTLGATDSKAPEKIAPFAVGLCLALIYLISIPITNGSANPMRSTSMALFVGGWAMDQLWLFWVAPISGGLLGAVSYRLVSGAWLEEDALDAAPADDRDSGHIM